jgi:carbonic anhydrase
LSDEFSLCGSGPRQSPVDFGEAIKPTAGAISFHHTETPLQIVNNGHTIQVNYAPGSYAELGGKRYELAQFHFHSPSEHTVAGKHCPCSPSTTAAGRLHVTSVASSKFVR